MQQFTSVIIQAKLSGTWTDISADVLWSPRPKFSRGIAGNARWDLLGGPGSFSFSLKNGTNSSAGLLGYYSPGHTNCRAGWGVGVYVRIIFGFDTWTCYKWHGKVKTDGIKVHSGIYGPRRVDVTAHDFMAQAAEHRLNLMQATTNTKAGAACDLLFLNMPVAPLETEYDTSFDAMPYLFDSIGIDTMAIAELKKISDSTRYLIFTKGGGATGEVFTVAIQGNDTFTAPIIAADATETLLDETGAVILDETGASILTDEREAVSYSDADWLSADISYAKYIANHVTATSYPRQIDAAATTVLATLEKASSLEAGQSETFRLQYKDPSGGNTKVNAVEVVTPAASTDFFAYANADGTGTNYTANMTVTPTTPIGSAEIEVTVTNTHASATFYYGGPDITFQVRGKGVYLYDPARNVARDATSIAAYGVRTLTIDMKYQDDVPGKYGASSGVLSVTKNPTYTFESVRLHANRSTKNMAAMLFAEPGAIVTLADTMTGLAADTHMLKFYEVELEAGANGAINAYWTGSFGTW
jgi:hypothetical protein